MKKILIIFFLIFSPSIAYSEVNNSNYSGTYFCTENSIYSMKQTFGYDNNSQRYQGLDEFKVKKWGSPWGSQLNKKQKFKLNITSNSFILEYPKVYRRPDKLIYKAVKGFSFLEGIIENSTRSISFNPSTYSATQFFPSHISVDAIASECTKF